MSSILTRSRVALALVAILGLAATARAQSDPSGVRGLEATFEKLAKDGTPRTVCVRSYLEDSGDKAGYGSGAIVSSDGYVLTCAHVVDIAKRCEVILSDASVHPATMLGKNRQQDYALLKIDAEGLPCFELGDSSKVKMGDWVVALGHPGGPYVDRQPAFSAGRVTGVHMKQLVELTRFYDDGIQTDVPIFAGNSGGPLVSLEGKLVGLNGAIFPGNENAYSVPINEAIADLATLKKGEMVEGKAPTQEEIAKIVEQERNPDMWRRMLDKGMKRFGKQFGGEDQNGGLLSRLFGREGLQTLQKLLRGLSGNDGKGGQGDTGDLAQTLEHLLSGDLNQDDLQRIFRGIGKLFGGGGDEGNDERQPTEGAGGFLGVQMGESVQDHEGVPISNVFDGSPAQKAGLMAQDIIVAVDGQDVATPDDVKAAIGSKAPGTKVTITYDRMVSGLWRRVDLPVTLGSKAPKPETAPETPTPNPTPAPGAGGFLGVAVGQATPETNGAPITDLMDGGPAQKAGLKKGDVIISIDGAAVTGIESIQSVLRSKPAGTVVKIKIARLTGDTWQRSDVDVTLGTRQP